MEIIDIPADTGLRLTVAQWCVDEWAHLYPDDTVQWYLDMYVDADAAADALPFALVAVEGDEVVGTASLIADDELPGAPEPGPWLAAVFVLPGHRGRGVGRALVDEVAGRAAGSIWLYTENETAWYESMGWTRVRESAVNGHPVTVMTRRG
jgi:GNAT superfamily N-acetyltransferase